MQYLPLLTSILMAEKASSAQTTRYANDWAVVVSEEYTADDIQNLAERHGFHNLGGVCECTSFMHILILVRPLSWSHIVEITLLVSFDPLLISH